MRAVHPAVVLIVAATLKPKKLLPLEQHARIRTKDRRLAGDRFQHIGRKRTRKESLGERSRFAFKFRQTACGVAGDLPRTLEARAIVVGELFVFYLFVLGDPLTLVISICVPVVFPDRKIPRQYESDRRRVTR